jgi:DNA-binding LytR/AlgR family response regulator
MAAKTSIEKVKYDDLIFFLILIPFINALNYYLTYTNIPFNSHTLITFLIDTFDGYAAWWGLRAVIIYLDKRMPYENNPLKRILLQLFFTSVVALAIIIVLTELVNAIAKDTPVPSSFYQYDIFIFLIWFFVLNGIYIGLHYYHEMKQVERLRLEDKKMRKEGFSVKDGRQNLIVPFDAITGFFVEGDYTVLVTTETKKYLIDRSLDKIEQSLPAELYFRLNRQYIIHRDIVKGFTKIENGKLNVLLFSSAYFPEQIQVSRTKAPGFKTWFHPNDETSA